MSKFIKICGILVGILFLLQGFGNKSYGLQRQNPEFTNNLKHKKNPNIIFIYCDDLGWGTVQAYNHSSVIPTPNMDKLADEGMRFTNAHTASSVCTPSRYGLLTGRYPWRTRLKKGVLFPPAKPLINKDRLTLGSLLKKNGYYTAVVGKWHLGLGWAMKDKKHINFNRPVSSSPNTLGFDYSYIMAGSADMPPYCFIKNGRVVSIPTIHVPKNEFGRAGLASPGLKPEDYLPQFTDNAIKVINEHAHPEDGKGQPLFLYYAMPSPHTPVAPSKRFQGKTQMGRYGDYVYETDYMIGQVIKALKKNNMYQNTLLIVSSDNGASPFGARRAMENGQDVNGPWRGYKSDIWEGGSRVPFIARWPGHIPAGTTQHTMISLADMMSTFAAITGTSLPPSAGVDSHNILPALLQPHLKNPIRNTTIVESIGGYFDIIQGTWKAEFVAGSGGWSHPNTNQAIKRKLPRVQLYNLSNDKGETHNLESEYPGKIWMLRHLLLHYIDNGRSTPGIAQQNWEDNNQWKQVTNWLEDDK